jgi:thioredoxin-related protein
MILFIIISLLLISCTSNEKKSSHIQEEPTHKARKLQVIDKYIIYGGLTKYNSLLIECDQGKYDDTSILVIN